MPLTMAKVGEINYIKKIIGKDDVRQHLAELGFVLGEEIRIVSMIGGNVITLVKNTRIALDKCMASRIMI